MIRQNNLDFYDLEKQTKSITRNINIMSIEELRWNYHIYSRILIYIDRFIDIINELDNKSEEEKKMIIWRYGLDDNYFYDRLGFYERLLQIRPKIDNIISILYQRIEDKNNGII